MDEREFEGMLEQAMKSDLSAGTDAFRDALLGRCLTELDAESPEADGGVPIPDDDLDLLAAAGNASLVSGNLLKDDTFFDNLL